MFIITLALELLTITTPMAPAIYFALILLFIPTVIIAEPVHMPIARRRPIKSRDWNLEANRLRKRYGYPSINSRLAGRGAVSGIPVLDQVHIVNVMFYIISSQTIGFRF